MSGWLLPICCTRRGASHARRNRPCQDASLCRCLWSADGLPVLLMAVADGHGASRHDRSDWGSRLACEQALAVVQSSLESRNLAAGRDGLEREHLNAVWLPWLGEELPARIHAGWLEATERHWQESGGGAPFSAEPYGTTLGLVVMTPHWWGRTGLGDWDLVRINAAGTASLIAQEDLLPSGGDTTLSLCLDQAAGLCRPRAALEPISPGSEAFSLLLCTDGIRKSCASDADFLTLAAWLSLAIRDPEARDGPGNSLDVPDLAAALDRISRDGSGDDVSLTLAHWSPTAAPPSLTHTGTAAAGVGAAVGVDLAVAAAAEAPAAAKAPAAAATEASDSAATKTATKTAASRRRRQPPLVRLISLVLILAAGTAASLLLLLLSRPSRQPAAAPLSRTFRSAERRALQAEIERLCQQPQTIPTALARRQALFDALAAGPLPRTTEDASSAGTQNPDQSAPQSATSLHDPLASLIRLSRSPRFAALPGLCTPLRAGLRQQWERREPGLRPSRRR